LLYIWKTSLDDAIRRIASLGFEGVEIRAGELDAAPRRLKPRDRRALRKTIESIGLSVYSLTPDWSDQNLASSNPFTRKESVRQVKEAIELAADLGAKYFTILPGRQHAIGAPPAETCRNWSLNSLTECVSIAEKLNVILCLEGAPDQIIFKEEDLLNMIRAVDSKSLLLAADTSHAYVLSDPPTYFRKIANYVGIVHIADTDGTPNAHLPLGLGKVDFRSVLETLGDIGYSGYYLLEIWYPEDPDWAAEHSQLIDKKTREVSDRFYTLVWSILFNFVVAEVLVVIFTYYAQYLSAAFVIGWDTTIISCAFLCISAAVLPLKRL
jgi:protein FrlC